MGSHHTIPLAGSLLALVTFVAMVLLNVDAALAASVLVVWIGSLILAGTRPPEPPSEPRPVPVPRDTMTAFIESSSTPLLITERDTISIANRAARNILGDHIVGQDPRMAFRQPEAISLLNAHKDGKALVRGLVRRRDIWQINRQSIDDNLAVVELINQTPEADISRAHTDFVANASHELRTPLAAIIGYVETLSESPDTLDTPTSTKFLNTILQEARRMQSLVGDLMSLSRVEAEKHEMPSDRLELHSIVERAARDAAGPERIGRLQINITQPAMVLGEQQQLEQLVRNLVDNAFKYGRDDTPVKVELDRTHDNQVRLSVSDQGEGITPEHIPHLTRRFYRTDPGRSRASGGTGLGLAIVKHIVERHRGRLDIQSEVGKGTKVVVRMPKVAESEDQNTSQPAPTRLQESSEAGSFEASLSKTDQTRELS